MLNFTSTYRVQVTLLIFSFFCSLSVFAQTLAFPGAEGFGRYASGARGVAAPTVYIVTNLNDRGAGSFRDAVSVPGRFVVFAVGGIVTLASEVAIAPNTTIAAQTAPGTGIVFFGKRISFTGSNNTISRYLRIRLGAANTGKDASGLANGSNIILDHMSITWGMDEVFSINWDEKGTSPDQITVQNSIIGQGLHRDNHSAGGLIQTPDGGQVSLIRNLYISNKTRNPKVKGVNEFVNNVVYDWGNGNRLGPTMDYGWSGEAYIMGGSAGVSEVNIINNYFMGGPLTPPSVTTPFSNGTATFNLYSAGNYFDNNRNGVLDGSQVPYNTTGYPGIAASGFKTTPYAYPKAVPQYTAQQAYSWVIDSVGANYPRRDQVDSLLVSEVASKGTAGYYVYRETDLPFSNGGVGNVSSGVAPADSDSDGMPDTWEDANGLNKNNSADAVQASSTAPGYLNIEAYINSLVTRTSTPPVTAIANGTYRIIARNSGKSLDVSGRSTADGANIIQWTYSGGTNQQWTVQSLGANAYSIRAVHSSKSFDIVGASVAEGADINQFTYSGTNSQRWKIESVGSGYFRIVSVLSGKAVEITGNSAADGAGINQRTYSGATNQQFTFQLLSSTASRTAVPATVIEENPITSSVYPNPSKNNFNVYQKGAFNYTVKDALGKTLEQGKAVNITSFGQGLRPGLYFLQIESPSGETKTVKVIKQ